MPLPLNLDLHVLRTFVTAFELGSFGRAAQRLGLSQSAVSNQLRKLQDQVGSSLVRKVGRGLELTTAGESMLGYAKRLLELNDEAVANVCETSAASSVRLGLPQDFAETSLPAILSRFARLCPNVHVEIVVDRSVVLIEKTMRRDLDLTLIWGDGAGVPNAERVAELPMNWLARFDWPGIRGARGEPLPFIAFAAPCLFRVAAIEALDHAGLAWQMPFTTPSLSGLWAALEGGLGITARTALGLPVTVTILDPQSSGLPILPTASVALCQAKGSLSPAVKQLKRVTLETIRKN